MSRTILVSMTTPRCIVPVQTVGQKVAYLEYHQIEFCDWFSKVWELGGGMELT